MVRKNCTLISTIYLWGLRVSLIKQKRFVMPFVCFEDFAPTILELAGLKPTADMTGRSFVGLLRGEQETERDAVFLERERHAQWVQELKEAE